MNTDTQKTSIVHPLLYAHLPEKKYLGKGSPFEMLASKTDQWEVGDGLGIGDYGVRIKEIQRDGNNIYVYVTVEYKDDSSPRRGGGRGRGD